MVSEPLSSGRSGSMVMHALPEWVVDSLQTRWAAASIDA